MQQADQRSELLVNGSIGAVFRQQQQQRLTAGEQAHRLAQGKELMPVGTGIKRKGMVLDKAFAYGGVPYSVLAFLKEKGVITEQEVRRAQPFGELRAELFWVQPNHQLPRVVETREPAAGSSA
ncbi:hypothetical protein KATP_32310 [Kluyvera ascorbata]|nr:hypothetical protein KATP_32310 [Kluyvera ascorbata]